ncbi:MAG: hypothetical protein ACTSVY_03850 [Candidatus Helarchaeota archaeon]
MCYDELESIGVKIKCRNEKCEKTFSISLDLTKENQVFECPNCNLIHFICYPKTLKYIIKVVATLHNGSIDSLISTRLTEPDYLNPISFQGEHLFPYVSEIMERSIIKETISKMQKVIIMGANQDNTNRFRERKEVQDFLRSRGIDAWFIEDLINILKNDNDLDSKIKMLRDEIEIFEKKDLETLQKQICSHFTVELIIILQHSHGPSKEFENLVKMPTIAPKIRLFIPEEFVPVGGIQEDVNSYDFAGPLTRFFRFFPNFIFLYRNLTELKNLIWLSITQYLNFFHY